MSYKIQNIPTRKKGAVQDAFWKRNASGWLKKCLKMIANIMKSAKILKFGMFFETIFCTVFEHFHVLDNQKIFYAEGTRSPKQKIREVLYKKCLRMTPETLTFQTFQTF